MTRFVPFLGHGRSLPVANWATRRRLSCPAEAARRTNRTTGDNVALILLALLFVLLTLAACSRVANPRGGSGATVMGDVLYIGSEEGEIVALDRDTGDFLWNYELGGEEENERGVYGRVANHLPSPTTRCTSGATTAYVLRFVAEGRGRRGPTEVAERSRGPYCRRARCGRRPGPRRLL